MTEIEDFARLRKLNSLEKPREIFLTQEPFSVDNELLTPTFKLKRNVGKKVFQAQIDALRQPLIDLVGKRADELCLKCPALEFLFCYKDKL